MSSDPLYYLSHHPSSVLLQPAKTFYSEDYDLEPDFLGEDHQYHDTEKFLAGGLPLDEVHSISFDGASRHGLDDSYVFQNPDVNETPEGEMVLIYDEEHKTTSNESMMFNEQQQQMARNHLPLCYEVNSQSNEMRFNEEQRTGNPSFYHDGEPRNQAIFLNQAILDEQLFHDVMRRQMSQCPMLFREVSKDSEAPPKQEVRRKRIKKNAFLRNKSKNEEKKNIHRYMIRQVIRCLTGEDFQKKVKELCVKFDTDYEEIKKYYIGQIENFTSIQLLSEHWSVDPVDQSKENRGRMVFREFSKWFLKERAIRYILNGKMKNPEKYIHYKNHIMLYYIEKPKRSKSTRLNSSH